MGEQTKIIKNLHQDVLDKGFITVKDMLGSDLTVVNSARVSFGKEKKEWDERDQGLINYLAKHKHFSPFRHVVIQFHVKAPEFVMRQWYKHVVGIETTSSYYTKDHAWNEISGRYVPVEDFYIPENWREQSEDNKQASKGNLSDDKNAEARKLFEDHMKNTKDVYDKLLALGTAKEQARIVLPLCQYTEVYWTASFQAIANFIELRNKPDAQWEIHEYAKAMDEMVRELLPHTYDAWFGNK